MDISSSAAIFTMIISLIESRDNISLYKDMKKECEKESRKVSKDYVELCEMGAEDIVKKTIKKINKDKEDN